MAINGEGERDCKRCNIAAKSARWAGPSARTVPSEGEGRRAVNDGEAEAGFINAELEGAAEPDAAKIDGGAELDPAAFETTEDPRALACTAPLAAIGVPLPRAPPKERETTKGTLGGVNMLIDY